MSWWYPRLRADGVIVSGNGELSVGGQAIGAGHSPQWLTENGPEFIVGGTPEGTVIRNVAGELVRALGFDFSPRVGNVSGFCAGAGHWCGFSDKIGLVYDGVLVDAAASLGAVDQQTGALHYLKPYQATFRDVVINGTVVRTGVAAVELVAGHNCATWGEYFGAIRGLCGWAPETGVVNLTPMEPTERLYVGMPAQVGAERWVVAGTDKGLVIFPWGGHQGYVREGNAFFHHALAVNGQLEVVSTDARGGLQREVIDLSAPRLDLRTYKPTTGTPPVEPPPIDPPDPPDPPENKVPHLTSPQLETLNRERDKYPKGEGVILTPQQIGDILNRTAWTHRNDVQPLGLQRKDSGTAAVMPNGQHIWNGIRLIVREDGVSKHYGGDVCGGCSVGKFSPVNADFKTAEETGPNGWIDAIDPEDDDLAARVTALEDQDKVLGMKDQELAAAILLLAGRVKDLEDAPAASLPDDVVRTSTHEVKTPLTFSSPLTGRIQKKG